MMQDEILNLALEKCISIFEETEKDTQLLKTDVYGKFPEYALFYYKEMIPGKTRLSNKDKILQVWKYSEKELTEIFNEDVEVSKSGMYYDVAKFYFEIESEKVKIQYVFGPRFGRGIEYSVKSENGKLFIGDEKVIWVS